jgi:hypothetical protein
MFLSMGKAFRLGRKEVYQIKVFIRWERIREELFNWNAIIPGEEFRNQFGKF